MPRRVADVPKHVVQQSQQEEGRLEGMRDLDKYVPMFLALSKWRLASSVSSLPLEMECQRFHLKGVFGAI